MYKLCIFDLDGTLADTIDSMSRPANRALAELGLPPADREKFKYFAGDGAATLCHRCLQAVGDTEEIHYEEFYPQYMKYFSADCMYGVHPYEGICETLKALKTAGVPITVLSNKPHSQAVNVVETLFGEGYFDGIQGQMDGMPKKPAPDGALKLAADFQVKPEECLYIGDTGTDMLTGSGAGMHTLGVLWGFRTRGELEENGADEIIEKPEEILRIAGVMCDRDGTTVYTSDQSGTDAMAGATAAETMSAGKNGAGITVPGRPRIRLIASDIDGTLVVEGSGELNPEYYEVITRLKEQGILFAAASGRSCDSVARLFAPVKDDIIFIVDNGASVILNGAEVFSAALNRKDTEDLVRFVRHRGDCHVLLSSKDTVYVETEDEHLLDLLINGYHNHVKVCKDVLAEEDRMVKAAIYYQPGIAKIAGPIMEEWKGRFHVMVAGDPWLDFVDYRADKGKALAGIQEMLGISPAETMVFGDNLNDTGMFEYAGESYAVANARPEVKEVAKHITDANVEDGVLKVLQRM